MRSGTRLLSLLLSLGLLITGCGQDSTTPTASSGSAPASQPTGTPVQAQTTPDVVLPLSLE